jgi:hypothetical protein
LTTRSYDVRVVALAIEAPDKWLDNLLSHHDVPGCEGSRQGISRRISDLGVLAIAVIRLLTVDAAIPVAHAVALVREAATDGGIGPLRTSSGLTIELPPGFVAALQEHLRDAMQSAPRHARGRPPLRER